MTDLFKPMLAVEYDPAQLVFPLLASAKLDGVRAIVRNGVVYSRSNKPIPNKFVQERFRSLEHYDGELIFGEPTAWDCYRRTVSAVMGQTSTDGADVQFHVFDHIQHLCRPYTDRLKLVDRHGGYVVHPQHSVLCMRTLLDLEQKMLDLGYEGLILRRSDAPYKRGRSTVKEGYLLKMKRFADAEAEVIGFEERMHNGNEATTNELGRTRRSSHQANKSGRGDLGALVVRMDGITFNIGTGFDDAERVAIWNNQAEYLHRTVKFKSFLIGVKEAPRHPVFLGWRGEVDV